MTEKEIEDWTIQQNEKILRGGVVNPALPFPLVAGPEIPVPEDDDYIEWLKKQNDEAGDEIIVPPITDAVLFDTELSILNYIESHSIENPMIALESDQIIPWINRWVAEQTQRPLVLSFGAFNHWAQTNHDLFFTKMAALDAYEEVLQGTFPNRFESPRIIKADEWIKFFQQYGASGVVGGSIDREGRTQIEAAYQRGYTAGSNLIESLTAVYYFSDSGEAAFARMAF